MVTTNYLPVINILLQPGGQGKMCQGRELAWLLVSENCGTL